MTTKLKPIEARQGRLGRPVLAVLVASLALALLIGGIVTLIAAAITDRDEAVQTTPAAPPVELGDDPAPPVDPPE